MGAKLTSASVHCLKDVALRGKTLPAWWLTWLVYLSVSWAGFVTVHLCSPEGEPLLFICVFGSSWLPHFLFCFDVWLVRQLSPCCVTFCTFAPVLIWALHCIPWSQGIIGRVKHVQHGILLQVMTRTYQEVSGTAWTETYVRGPLHSGSNSPERKVLISALLRHLTWQRSLSGG